MILISCIVNEYMQMTKKNLYQSQIGHFLSRFY